jgi:hypothetical protein
VARWCEADTRGVVGRPRARRVRHRPDGAAAERGQLARVARLLRRPGSETAPTAETIEFRKGSDPKSDWELIGGALLDAISG